MTATHEQVVAAISPGSKTKIVEVMAFLGDGSKIARFKVYPEESAEVNQNPRIIRDGILEFFSLADGSLEQISVGTIQNSIHITEN